MKISIIYIQILLLLFNIYLVIFILDTNINILLVFYNKYK